MNEVSNPRRGLTARRAVYAILGVQIGIAVVLAGADLIGAIPQILNGPRAPALDAPVTPGDQVRRFRPADLPGRDRVSPGQQSPIPDPGDMPSRLRFTIEGDVALVTGDIAPGDAMRFEDWLAEDRLLAAIRLHSPGGSVDDALAIGRAVRDAGLDTVMQEGDICLSACPYILAGGVARQVDEGAVVGVHQHYFGESTALPAFLAVEDIQRGQANVMAHLDAMGIDLRVMQHAMSTPPAAIYVLLPEELLEYRLVWDGDADAAAGDGGE